VVDEAEADAAEARTLEESEATVATEQPS
jgi:hypothetical protein